MRNSKTINWWTRNYEQDTSPCKDCKDRKPDCHGNCQKYINWKNHDEKI